MCVRQMLVIVKHSLVSRYLVAPVTNLVQLIFLLDETLLQTARMQVAEVGLCKLLNRWQVSAEAETDPVSGRDSIK